MQMTAQSLFESLEPAPPDAILGLTEAFKADSNSNKINLGVGVYQDEQGKTPVLKVVKEAEKRILASENTKSYLGIPGSPAFGERVRELLFGASHDVIASSRACTAHTPGGTGALRVGADFLSKTRPDATIWMSSPTWANHKGIFGAAGIPVKDYPYYSAETRGVDYESMIDALRKVPAGDVVLLHVCCHNPTGVDLTLAQWEEVASVAEEKGWLPFLDFAYQGFGDSIEEDRAAVVTMADKCPEMFVASSFSKNLGLYRERTGALTFVGSDAKSTASVFSHMKITIRTNYSNPAAHGGLIAETVLGDEGLRKAWLVELQAMRDRIKDMRSAFVDGLKAKGITQDFSYLIDQRGMFSFSGLTDAQVAFLKDEKSIYIVKGGRINVAGITPSNIDYLTSSVAEALGK